MVLINFSVFKLLRRFVRILMLSLLAILILANLFIILSGRYYLYKGVASTYLIGESGPNIYDMDNFHSNKIYASNKPYNWKEHPQLSEQKLPSDIADYLKETQTTAFLVFKDDRLIFEKYFDEHSEEKLSNVFSASKTVTALMIGVAIAEGKIGSIDDPVGKYLEEYNEGEKTKITIRHLLQMASGLDWEESGKNPLSSNAESYYGSDLYGMITRQKVINEPGKTFIYQSGNSQILGFILEKATGETLSEYVRKKLWEPIGAESDAYWSLDKKNGDEKAFCCLNTKARDAAKIGKLLLNRGAFEGKQVVPEDFINEMFTMQDLSTEEGVENHQYGLHIWIYENHSSPVYYCRGIKGQYIFAIPEENLLIVRFGKKRKPNFVASKTKGLTREELLNIGHPADVPVYIKFGSRLAEQIVK